MYWRHTEDLPVLCIGAYVILLLKLKDEETQHAVIGKTHVMRMFTDEHGETRWEWGTDVVHDPNKRGYPPVVGVAGYIMLVKQV